EKQDRLAGERGEFTHPPRERDLYLRVFLQPDVQLRRHRPRHQLSRWSVEDDRQDQERERQGHSAGPHQSVPFNRFPKHPTAERRFEEVGQFGGSSGPALHGPPPAFCAPAGVRAAPASSGCHATLPSSANLWNVPRLMLGSVQRGRMKNTTSRAASLSIRWYRCRPSRAFSASSAADSSAKRSSQSRSHSPKSRSSYCSSSLNRSRVSFAQRSRWT